MVSYPKLDEKMATAKKRDASKITIRDSEYEIIAAAELIKKTSTFCGIPIKVVTLLFIVMSLIVLTYKTFFSTYDHEMIFTLNFIGVYVHDKILHLVVAIIQFAVLISLLISLTNKPKFVMPTLIYHILLVALQVLSALPYICFTIPGSRQEYKDVVHPFFGTLCDVVPICDRCWNVRVGYALLGGTMVFGSLINCLIVAIATRLLEHLLVVTMAENKK